jgi:hypothetical protein
LEGEKAFAPETTFFIHTVVTNGSLNSMRRSEKAEMPGRAWAKKSGKRKSPGLESTNTHNCTQTHISRGSGWHISTAV